MITEDYVSFETAKLLKEKGFDWECLGTYSTGDKELSISSECPYSNDLNDDMFIAAPTLQMGMKWLREDHHIHILPQISDPSQVNPKYYIVIWTTGTKRESYILELFNSYEEAVEEGIKYCLEDLI